MKIFLKGCFMFSGNTRKRLFSLVLFYLPGCSVTTILCLILSVHTTPSVLFIVVRFYPFTSHCWWWLNYTTRVALFSCNRHVNTQPFQIIFLCKYRSVPNSFSCSPVRVRSHLITRLQKTTSPAARILLSQFKWARLVRVSINSLLQRVLVNFKFCTWPGRHVWKLGSVLMMRGYIVIEVNNAASDITEKLRS